MGCMNSPTADVSVRVAWADDAPAVAAVQARVWELRYDGVLPDEARTVDVEAAAQAWRAAIDRPRDARQRVLVALARNEIQGYAVCSPAEDPDCDPVRDGELVEIAVLPDRLGQGHGSRLLHAAIDTLRADRFERAVSWLPTTDDAGRRFLTDAGWATDGAHRELDLDGSGAIVVKQVRLHCSTAE